MKQLVLFLLLSSFILNAQILDKSNVWHEMETRYIVCKSPKCEKDIQVITNIYSIEKDTTISNKIYSKIKDTIFYSDGKYTLSTPGCIRQDGKKVYFRPSSLDELLIYDFSLQIGNTFSTYSQLYTVTSVDSIIINGNKYLQIQLIDMDDAIAERNDTLQWIEGIGAKEGFLYPINAEGLLLCFYNNSGLVYQNNKGYECKEISAGVKTKNNLAQIRLYPNPSNGFVNIEGISRIESVQLFDIYGKKIMERKQNSDSSILLNLANLPKGIYFIKTNSITKKLIIK
jgi:hypothetical protein